MFLAAETIEQKYFLLVPQQATDDLLGGISPTYRDRDYHAT